MTRQYTGCIVWHCHDRDDESFELLVRNQCVGEVCKRHGDMIAHLDGDRRYILDEQRCDGWRLIQRIGSLDDVVLIMPHQSYLSEAQPLHAV